MYTRILVALDGSDTAEQALPHAAALAKLFDAELVLLRILEPLAQVRGVSPSASRSVKQQAQEWAEEYFEQIGKDLSSQGIQVRREIIAGRPGVGITRYAEENDVDLIVLCSRGRTGLSRWLIGGVADRVLRGTPAPVLLIPANVELAAREGVGA